MENLNFEEILEQLQPYIKILSPEQWAVVGGIIFILFVLSRMRRGAKKRKKLKKVAANLVYHAFQIAPLGRDAFFKIKNTGELATLTGITIKGRKDILVKNAVVGHQLEKDKVYSILLETGSAAKIVENFTIELSYFDQGGNNFKQSFPLNQRTAKQAKLQKR